jgi:hypothetical protein
MGLVVTTREEDFSGLLVGLLRLEGRGLYFDSLGNRPYDKGVTVRAMVMATATSRVCYYLDITRTVCGDGYSVRSGRR